MVRVFVVKFAQKKKFVVTFVNVLCPNCEEAIATWSYNLGLYICLNCGGIRMECKNCGNHSSFIGSVYNDVCIGYLYKCDDCGVYRLGEDLK
jgi:ribosomal protein S27E